MSNSEIHQALKRAKESDLFNARREAPNIRNLEEFVLHGLRYAFPAKRGSRVKGIPTSYAAPPLNQFFPAADYTHPPVWACADGSASGYALAPLYKSVPQSAMADSRLYEFLILVDAIREGRARERKIASELLLKEFANYFKLTTAGTM